MSAADTLTPAQAAVVALFAYTFRAAPTADLVADGTGFLAGGGSPGALLDALFAVEIPGSPFGAYAADSADADFAAALVHNFCVDTAVGAATRAAWAADIETLVAMYPSRGELVAAIVEAIDDHPGTDPDVLALRSALHDRVDAAAAFLLSPAAARWDGTVEQLLEPLRPPPPPPTYALSAGPAVVEEGASVTFTLSTTGLAGGSTVGYTLGGAGIGAADLAAGALAGSFTVGDDGRAQTVVAIAADATTEGTETLRLSLDVGLGAIDVQITDTSTTPPTYTLSSDVAHQSEGGRIVYTLATTDVAAGSVVLFTLGGSGITAADVAGGALNGRFTIGADGRGTASVDLAADTTTEGPEVLRLLLAGGRGQVDVTIDDTSVAPPPVGRPDLVIVADRMDDSRATRPPTPAEGEIRFDTYLSADLLDQHGGGARRLTVAELRASGTAGAPLDATNQSAERGNVPQVSNPSLFTFDLGLDVDRVDYSAEAGHVVAIVGADAAAAVQRVLVNDDAVDDDFDDRTDRIDTLIDVEQIVASRGGGVIDLTASARDWVIEFSHRFGEPVDTTRDREISRVMLLDASTGAPAGRTYLDYRDAGGSSTVTQRTAAWTVIEGSDHDEALELTDHESQEDRSSNLRGGDNHVGFNDLTRSIAVELAWSPWRASASPADDTNSSGVLEAEVRFSDGRVVPPGSPVHTVRSHTADNGVAAGTLWIAGSQDDTDEIGFDGTALPLRVTLGAARGASDVVRVRLRDGPAADSLELSGFETLADPGGSDDVYDVENLTRAIGNGPDLDDSSTPDHDAVRVRDDAVGHLRAGGIDDTLELAELNDNFGVEFAVLDVAAVTVSDLVLRGTSAADEEVVLGPLAQVDAVSGFEAVVLTPASVDRGTRFRLDLDSGVVRAVSTVFFTFDGHALSAGGLGFGADDGGVAPVPVGLHIDVVDHSAGSGAVVIGGAAADDITGGQGDDLLRGGGGDDALDGGSVAETWRFLLDGTPDAVAAAGNRLTLTLTVDGTVLTLVEAAVADTAYGDGQGAFVDGATHDTIGAALAALVNANRATVNGGPGSGMLQSATFSAADGALVLDFDRGIDVDDVVTLVIDDGATPDGGSFAIGPPINEPGGLGGADTFVFEATASANGADTIDYFGVGEDRLDVSAFVGAAIASAAAAIDADDGGTFSGPATRAQFVFDKPDASLAVEDFAIAPADEKFVIADGVQYVVVVTEDRTGARGDAFDTPMALYYVANGPVAGLADLDVQLVGLVSGVLELTLAEVFDALT